MQIREDRQENDFRPNSRFIMGLQKEKTGWPAAC